MPKSLRNLGRKLSSGHFNTDALPDINIINVKPQPGSVRILPQHYDRLK